MGVYGLSPRLGIEDTKNRVQIPMSQIFHLQVEAITPALAWQCGLAGRSPNPPLVLYNTHQFN